MRAAELRNRQDADLAQEVSNARQEMFNLRFQLATGKTVNTARIRKLRRDIGRMQTILRERQEL